MRNNYEIYTSINIYKMLLSKLKFLSNYTKNSHFEKIYVHLIAL